MRLDLHRIDLPVAAFANEAVRIRLHERLEVDRSVKIVRLLPSGFRPVATSRSCMIRSEQQGWPTLLKLQGVKNEKWGVVGLLRQSRGERNRNID
ncbi:hypothetical protein [Kaistia soli]|uniref:hypothetical protein n=1 Tax=Kaistia soli TaxID=446684 RepID=UPI001587F93B|nr:hypothetical protein [Kaistia soli]